MERRGCGCGCDDADDEVEVEEEVGATNVADAASGAEEAARNAAPETTSAETSNRLRAILWN